MDERAKIARRIGGLLEALSDLESSGIIPEHEASKYKKTIIAMLIDAAERLHKEEIEEMNKEKMATKLIELRGNRTRRGVANDLGIHENTLYLLELGQIAPTAETMKKIADYYEEPVDNIFFTD